MQKPTKIPITIDGKSIGNVGKDIQNQFKTSLNSVKIDTFDKQLSAWQRKNTKSATVAMLDGTKTYGQAMTDYHNEINTLLNDIQANNGKMTQEHVDRFNAIRDGVRNLQAEVKATGNEGLTMGEKFANAFGSISRFATSYLTIRQVFRVIRDGISTVVALDDALVDLQKTSTATPKQLNAFYKEANDIAKEYGTTTQQVIQGAADWSRLGYNLEDSKTMSKLSSQFAAISPGMSVDESTSSLVSTMKAFGIEADGVLDGIMSKVNKVGNNFALSNADVMTALSNSSAAMSAANASFEETVALITAGQEIVQDSSKVGKLRCPNIQQCMVRLVA